MLLLTTALRHQLVQHFAIFAERLVKLMPCRVERKLIERLPLWLVTDEGFKTSEPQSGAELALLSSS
jgi:hypothetical protein